MKTIASLLMRAKTLKRFGTRSAVEKQIAKIIEHPDLEAVCSLLDSLQKFSFLEKAAEDSVVEKTDEDILNEQDVADLDLDIVLDHDEETAEDLILVDDLLEDSNPIEQDKHLEEVLHDEVECDYDDLEIIIDEEAPAEEEEKVEEEKKEEAKAKLVKAKLASKPAKIIVSKASILAKKKAIR